MTQPEQHNQRHNHRTADISSAIAHGRIAVDEARQKARTLANLIAEALPNDATQRPEPDAVTALLRETDDAWQTVALMAAGTQAVPPPPREREALRTKVDEFELDDPELLTLVAESAQLAICRLINVNSALGLGKRSPIEDKADSIMLECSRQLLETTYPAEHGFRVTTAPESTTTVAVFPAGTHTVLPNRVVQRVKDLLFDPEPDEAAEQIELIKAAERAQ